MQRNNKPYSHTSSIPTTSTPAPTPIPTPTPTPRSLTVPVVDEVLNDTHEVGEMGRLDVVSRQELGQH